MDTALREQCDSRWIPTFFRKIPLIERPEKFQTYSIEEQYSIFICGNQRWHPPELDLAASFALNGKAGVDFLKVKLSHAKDDLTIRDIILVFREMCRQKSYNVKADNELMGLITDSVAKIKDNDWKQVTQQWVEDIQQGEGLKK
jgi:hypothetical protein